MRRRPFHFARAPSAPIGLIADATTRSRQRTTPAARPRRGSSTPERSIAACAVRAAVATLEASVLGAAGSHLFPSRTQQLSPPAPKILGTSVPGKIGQGRDQTTSTRDR